MIILLCAISLVFMQSYTTLNNHLQYYAIAFVIIQIYTFSTIIFKFIKSSSLFLKPL